MTEETESPPAIDLLYDKLEQMHGHRMTVSMQMMSECNPKDAVRAQGQADACLAILRMVEALQEHGEIGGDDAPTYQDMSRSMRRMDQAAKEQERKQSGLLNGFR